MSHGPVSEGRRQLPTAQSRVFMRFSLGLGKKESCELHGHGKRRVAVLLEVVVVVVEVEVVVDLVVVEIVEVMVVVEVVT